MAMVESPSTRSPVFVSRGELMGLTIGLWIGGVCLLALLPVILMARLGPTVGLTLAYLTFFATWQPVKGLLERALGARGALVRMLALTASAAVVAYYVRDGLLYVLEQAR